MFQEFRPKRQQATVATPPVAGPVYGSAPADPHVEATSVLLRAAGASQWPLAHEDQRRMLRRARAKSHPDLNNGDQARWDEVQDAARILKLV